MSSTTLPGLSSVKEIEEAILSCLRGKTDPVGFRNLEKDVEGQLNGVEGTREIVQAAWRLIGSRELELTPEYKLKIKR